MPQPKLYLPQSRLNLAHRPRLILTGARREDRPALVKALFGANLVAHWQHNEPNGTVVYDSSPNLFNGTYTSCLVGQDKFPDGRTGVYFDGSTSYADMYSVAFRNAFPYTEGTLIQTLQIPAAAWIDGIARYFCYFAADSNNNIYMYKMTTNSTVRCLYKAGSTVTYLDFLLTKPLDLFTIGLTWSKINDQVIIYYRGNKIGAIQTGLGTWSGTLASTTTLLGANTKTPANVLSGYIKDTILVNRPATQAEMMAAGALR